MCGTGMKAEAVHVRAVRVWAVVVVHVTCQQHRAQTQTFQTLTRRGAELPNATVVSRLASNLVGIPAMWNSSSGMMSHRCHPSLNAIHAEFDDLSCYLMIDF